MTENVRNQTLLTQTDTEILGNTYDASEFIVPDLIPVGLTILAGKPKSGKSLAAMDMAISLANGSNFLGRFQMVQQQDVLYLALEDTERRIQTRLNKLTEDPLGTGRLHCATECPRLDQGFFENIESWRSQKPAVKLIIIDTLNRVRGSKRRGTSPYEKDYNEINELKKYADLHKVAILVVHHLRKSEAKDLTDMISGSTGLTAAADAILILQKERGSYKANFFATGRDIPDFEIGLTLNPESLTWEIAVPTEELTTERAEVLAALQGANGPMKLGEIADLVQKKKNNVHKLLAGLIASGQVKKVGYGIYEAIKAPEAAGDNGQNGGESSESGESPDIAAQYQYYGRFTALCKASESDHGGESSLNCPKDPARFSKNEHHTAGNGLARSYILQMISAAGSVVALQSNVLFLPSAQQTIDQQ